MPYIDEEDETLDALHSTMQNRGYWCEECKHLHDFFGHTCDAFPKQIPDSILTGSRRHLEREPRQDNDIVFERKEEEK